MKISTPFSYIHKVWCLSSLAIRIENKIMTKLGFPSHIKLSLILMTMQRHEVETRSYHIKLDISVLFNMECFMNSTSNEFDSNNK